MIEENIDSLINQFKKLEENIVSILTDSNSDVELILKELLVYLNSTSSALKQIQVQTEPIKMISLISDQLSSVESNLKDLPREIQKIIDEQERDMSSIIRSMYEPVKNFISKLSDHTKMMSSAIRQQNQKVDDQSKLIQKVLIEIDNLNRVSSSNKQELLTSQENLIKVIDSILKNTSDVSKSSFSLKQTEINRQADLQKQAKDFWLKIIGYVLGSGGLLYFIVNLIIGATR